MRNKLILFSLMAIVGIFVLAVASVTVFALGVGLNDAVLTGDAVEAIEAVPVVQPEVAPISYGAQKSHAGGCNWAAKQQMTYQNDKDNLETAGDQLLTQVQQ